MSSHTSSQSQIEALHLQIFLFVMRLTHDINAAFPAFASAAHLLLTAAVDGNTMRSLHRSSPVDTVEDSAILFNATVIVIPPLLTMLMRIARALLFPGRRSKRTAVDFAHPALGLPGLRTIFVAKLRPWFYLIYIRSSDRYIGRSAGHWMP
ncbi:hypothetical protein BDV12DRAFT_125170 [Aspergillus spectabilis]